MTEARRLLYRSDEKILHYRRGVVMRSDKINLKGKQVDVTLDSDTNEVLEIQMEGNVEIEAEEGKAKGDNAKYLPKTKKYRFRARMHSSKMAINSLKARS